MKSTKLVIAAAAAGSLLGIAAYLALRSKKCKKVVVKNTTSVRATTIAPYSLSEQVKTVLDGTNPTQVRDERTSPIYVMLRRQQRYKNQYFSIEYRCPPMWETLDNRMRLHDPTAGCVEANDLPVNGGDCKDIVHVEFHGLFGSTNNEPDASSKPYQLQMMFYLSHLIHPDSLFFFPSDDEDDVNEPIKIVTPQPAVKNKTGHHRSLFPLSVAESRQRLDEAYVGGADVGFIIWDASVVISTLLFTYITPENVKGKRVLEVGCGLGLAGFVAAIMGGIVGCTDRGPVIDLVRYNIQAHKEYHKRENGTELDIFASELDWTSPEGVGSVVAQLGGTPDYIFAADCIFELIYPTDNAFPLLKALLLLLPTRSDCLVLLSCTRRLNDGIDKFIIAAAEFFSVELLIHDNATLCFGLRRHR